MARQEDERLLEMRRSLQEEVGEEQVVEERVPPRRRGRLPASSVPASKEDLVDYVSRDLECSKAVARAVVDSTCRGIVELTHARSKIRLPKLGEFKVLGISQREGRNPRTGEPVPIAEGRRIIFRAAKPFKDLINGLVPRRFK